MDFYLANSKFLAGIEETPGIHNTTTFTTNLSSLKKFVLMFNEVTVVQKQGSWFGSYDPQNGSLPWKRTIIPMREQELYLHDTTMV